MQISTSSCLPSKIGIPVATDRCCLHSMPFLMASKGGASLQHAIFKQHMEADLQLKLFLKAIHDFLMSYCAILCN